MPVTVSQELKTILFQRFEHPVPIQIGFQFRSKHNRFENTQFIEFTEPIDNHKFEVDYLFTNFGYFLSEQEIAKNHDKRSVKDHQHHYKNNGSNSIAVITSLLNRVDNYHVQKT